MQHQLSTMHKLYQSQDYKIERMSRYISIVQQILHMYRVFINSLLFVSPSAALRLEPHTHHLLDGPDGGL